MRLRETLPDGPLLEGPNDEPKYKGHYVEISPYIYKKIKN